MANKLFSLFDDKLRSPDELMSGPVQTLDSIGGNIEDTETILRKIKQFEIVKPKVDYSNFSNFVFFNSALDYFNITGEKILNEFPYDGASETRQLFIDSLDGYQRYVENVWPKTTGYLKFDPSISASYISVEDVGRTDGSSRTSLLNPGTGSFAFEFWSIPPPALTGTTDVMVIGEKLNMSTIDGYAFLYTGSMARMIMASGGNAVDISVPTTPGVAQYFCFSIARTSATSVVMSAFTGSAGKFPVLVSYTTSSVGYIDCGSQAFIIGTSGSSAIPGAVSVPLTGALDDVRIWKTERTLVDITSSFNSRIYARDGLAALWTFNETGSLGTESHIVLDSSGHRLNGRITGYHSAMRVTGTLLPYDVPDNVLSLNCPAVTEYITEQQASGTTYDRDNDNIATKLLPEKFTLLEELNNTSALKNFLWVLARGFDQIKVSIDQFTNVLRSNYGSFNQTPDALLQDIAKFFGWEFTGNFLNSDVLQYIIGKQVLANTASNKALDVKLYEIKNEFWKRTLINLMHMYKTKGTRESVESLLRVYGVNRNFVKLKEYGLKPADGIRTTRIVSEKSVPALTFGSGSALTTNRVVSSEFYGPVLGVETRLRFPTTTTVGLTASLATGSIWSINSGSAGTMKQSLTYARNSATSLTGSFTYSGSEGSLTISGLPVFDNRWCNVVVNKDYLSSSLEIDVRVLERDEIVYHASASYVANLITSSLSQSFWLGSTGSLASQYWAQEVRIWTQPLSDAEMNDHALNFQSFGTEEVDGLSELLLHWRLNENVVEPVVAYDFSANAMSGTGAGFLSSVNPYKKFLNEFNYIASPEFGWSEDKIRSLSSSTVRQGDAFTDNTIVALEFNLVDALNEDISQILSTLDTFNEIVGAPVNRYRDSYPDLDVLRNNYFKRLHGSLNFRVFADLLEFFDRSFVDMIRRLIPARVTFLGDEFVVESHMLERPKLQWNYRRKEREFQPEGVIKVFIRS